MGKCLDRDDAVLRRRGPDETEDAARRPHNEGNPVPAVLGWDIWRTVLVTLSMAAVVTIAGSAFGATENVGDGASFIIGAQTSYHGKDVEEIARSIRQRSDDMLIAMSKRDPVKINDFYGDNTTYVGSGEIGDWSKIIAGTASRYAARRSVNCRWNGPFRIDVLSHDIAMVTAKLACDIVDTTSAEHHSTATRLEVMQRLSKGWTIIGVHEDES
jgi:hypothetical protein